MGYRGYYSNDHGDSDNLESLDGSETEEDEDGNPLPKKINKGVKIEPWIRSVDLRNPKLGWGWLSHTQSNLRRLLRSVQSKTSWVCGLRRIQSIRLRSIANGTAHSNCMLVLPRSRVGIHNHIEKKYKLDVGVQTITRAKRKAKRMNEGHYIDQYNSLAAYRKKLLRSNPGSTVEIKTCMDGDIRRFQRMYICFAACKNGWMNGCRPIIGLDGCHIKGHHPGLLLTAVGIYANNGMFPIAYAIAEAENQET
ncbi:uncharacterized protein LOC133711125 [Rosa rugosa]|uniref:uncharacterized protein LOC133711125 n=1 Tax=Rosa rugosa TaxID=74645 RepID=UPI002B41459D|nr:uncharacterized protein LOC133711125 [Rosa rugosa]